jgi:5-methylcytosine-specific restriction endonuclease McrA
MRRNKKRKRRSGTRLVSKEYRLAMYMRDKCRCVYCGVQVVPGAPITQSNAATLEHIVPVTDGGSNSYTNLVTCCAYCNDSRGAKSNRKWFPVLRERGIDTKAVGRRLAAVATKNITPYRKTAQYVLLRERQVRAVLAFARWAASMAA